RYVTKNNVYVSRPPALQAGSTGGLNERPVVGLLVPDFIAGVAQPALGNGDGQHDLVGRQDVLALLGRLRRVEEAGQVRLFPFAVRSEHVHDRAQGDQGRGQRRRTDDNALMPLSVNSVVAVLAVQREALVAALEQALDVLVAEIPAAIALAEVAAERAHIL